MEAVESDQNAQSAHNGSRLEFFKTYSRFCKIFGCFPVQIQPCGSLSFTWLRLSTFWAVVMTLMYFIITVDKLAAMIPWYRDGNCTLSEVIITFPPKIGRGISDALIHWVCTLYCFEYIKLANILSTRSSVGDKGRQKLETTIFAG